jgi:hypothetical protein
MYLLIGTAKLNGVDPQAWLADVLARIADHPAQHLAEIALTPSLATAARQATAGGRPTPPRIGSRSRCATASGVSRIVRRSMQQ